MQNDVFWNKKFDSLEISIENMLLLNTATRTHLALGLDGFFLNSFFLNQESI